MKFDGLIIASDLDGTFLGEHSEVLENNIEAINHFKSNGGLFTFSTGRNEPALFRLVPGAASIANAPAIMTNGSYISDFSNGKKYFETFLDPEPARSMMKRLKAAFPGVGARISVGDLFLVPYMTEKLLRELERYLDITIEKNIDEIDGAGWNKIVISGTAKEISQLIEWFADPSNGGEEYALSYSCPVLYEIMNKSATKGIMLRNLKKMYGGITTVAVGDYNNDLDMLMAADISACPENAIDQIKAVSKLHLCHHRDGAIADLISKL